MPVEPASEGAPRQRLVLCLLSDRGWQELHSINYGGVLGDYKAAAEALKLYAEFLYGNGDQTIRNPNALLLSAERFFSDNEPSATGEPDEALMNELRRRCFAQMVEQKETLRSYRKARVELPVDEYSALPLVVELEGLGWSVRIDEGTSETVVLLVWRDDREQC